MDLIGEELQKKQKKRLQNGKNIQCIEEKITIPI